MLHLRLFAFLLASLHIAASQAADPPRRVLLVTHAGGHMHESLLVAEQVLKEIGPKQGLDVTCFRFTSDPDAMVKVKRQIDGKETVLETTALEDYSFRFRQRNGEVVTRAHCGRINAGTLKNYDAVVFFTTSTWYSSRGSHPVNADELQDLLAWVRGGGGFVGVHCATDTLYGTPYGDLVGAVFDGHPWIQQVRLRIEDAEHPAAAGWKDGPEIFDEIYQFHFVPYNRDRLHIILSVDNSSIDVKKGNRTSGIFTDQDYAVSWCRRFGKGRSFYTSLGHFKEVWRNPRFQAHLIGGLQWALGRLPGDATPSANLKK